MIHNFNYSGWASWKDKRCLLCVQMSHNYELYQVMSKTFESGVGNCWNKENVNKSQNTIPSWSCRRLNHSFFLSLIYYKLYNPSIQLWIIKDLDCFRLLSRLNRTGHQEGNCDMSDSFLFQLPPELLCGLSSYLPGEELRRFGDWRAYISNWLAFSSTSSTAWYWANILSK